jgi:pyruvate,water dikinase
MGAQAFRFIAGGMAALAGYPPPDPAAGPPVLVEAAQRLFFDITALVRSPQARELFVIATRHMEARTSGLVERLSQDPRLAAAAPARPQRGALRVAMRTRMPVRIAGALLDPARARARIPQLAEEVLALGDLPPQAAAEERLRAVERLLRHGFPRFGPAAVALAAAGMAAYAAAARLLAGIASDEELETVRRGLPHNPTTEMDLELWQLAERSRGGPAAAQALREHPPAALAAAYRRGELPDPLHEGLAEFLRVYGHRGVAEIDLGLPRWSEDPTHLLGVLANYLRLENAELAPDAQFRQAAEAAERMVAELARRAGKRGRWRGALVRFLLGRVRELAGIREAPKFHLVRFLAMARALLQPVGEVLASEGRLATGEDIFFLSLPEAQAGLNGTDWRATVQERRAEYAQELRRRHVPRLLLSDGTEPEALQQTGVAAGDDDPRVLRGTPASSGCVTGKARVILEPTGAHLEPGEILVAPSTDPAWTPLFLTAGGLVMEMGGPMSHGAVVAREYGIPAVVGVPQATERIRTGEELTMDGTAGIVQRPE